jgi:DNA replication licensing factor MCM6
MCGNRSDFTLMPAISKYADWQKLRMQENPDEVPSGAMPRSMEIIVRNEVVEKAKAGDKVIVTGSAIVVPDITQLMGNTSIQRDGGEGRGEGLMSFYFRLWA